MESKRGMHSRLSQGRDSPAMVTGEEEMWTSEGTGRKCWELEGVPPDVLFYFEKKVERSTDEVWG